MRRAVLVSQSLDDAQVAVTREVVVDEDDDAPVCTGCGRPFPKPERREPVNFDDDRIT